MATQINTTELDFNQIKNNLRNYFNRDSGPFRDFDFTGSGLNNLLDILAYNTHYNAVTAHMVMNESFLDSAQVRGNVVSRAKLLGYTPTSRTGATASVNVVFNRSAAGDSAGITAYQMVKGTKFNAIIDNTTYIFQTTEDYTSSYDASTDTFTFNNVTLKQGVQRLDTFTIDNTYNQRFVIKDKNIDTSTLVVKVYDSLTATSYSVYNKFTSFNALDNTSEVYYLYENTDGNFEVQFGNDIIGKRPLASGRVVFEYLSTSGTKGNTAKVFTYAQTGTANVSIVSVTTVSPAAGGAEVEDIDSIKFNAPLSFISQDRAVTKDDFRAIIKQEVTGIKDVIAYGGEEDTNPKFGTVYIACKPEGAELLTDLQKEQILTVLNKKKVIGITPEIVDPVYLYLYLNITFRYNAEFTNLTASEVGTKIRKEVEKYANSNLNNFDGKFRHSNLIARLDTADQSVLSNSVDVFAYKKLLITVDPSDTQEINFGFEIAGTIDQTPSLISSTTYTKNGFIVSLADEPISGDTEKRNVYSFRSDASGAGGIIKVDESVGFLYPSTGVLALGSLVPDAVSDNTTINITVQPATKDVFVTRNDILEIDMAKVTVTGLTDNEARSTSTSSTSTSSTSTTATSGY
tara:strand:- start:1920 stop:3806 length:1887 start_codon:yes stop_codon:yes gene_type:complete